MIINSRYTKAFVSNNLTSLKYDELIGFSINIRDHKNTVSEYVNSNLRKYLDYKRLDFIKEMRAIYYGVIPSSFDYQLYGEVYDSYQNKFDAVKKHLKIEVIHYLGIELYKRTTKKHKQGEFKSIKKETKQTDLSTCLTYLARYGSDNTVEYITNQLLSNTLTDDKRKYYNNILRCINKFGFDSLYKLALSKRERIINKYAETPITFKKITFSGRSRKKVILDYNKHYGSVINAFVSLSGINRPSFDIPVRFAKDYHGKIKDYFKSNPDYEYTITFNEKTKQINIHICKDGERYIPEIKDSIETNTIGIDVNCKHNLFALSNGCTFDYDRKLVSDYCRLCTEIDNNKKFIKNYKVGKRKQFKLDTLKRKITKSEQQLIADICKELSTNGITHVVMEDLDNWFGKCYVKDGDNDGINYNRKVKFLGLSSLKNEFDHIGRKYNIGVSTVQSSYTSKMCPVCGCIDDDNRLSQEEFECIECGYKENADINAAINIKNRVLLTVLRDKLLKQVGNGTYEPKKLKREKVKEVLLSFRRSLLKVGSERGSDGTMSIFDYV